METIWRPKLSDSDGPVYRAIADALGRDIDAGRIAAGSRLPTMRALAEALEVTVGTVLRAYTLAEKRGLISRQVGRGTFVRAGDATAGAGDPGAGGRVVDLSRNEPAEIRIGQFLRRALIELSRDDDLDDLLTYGDSQGQLRHREILSGWIRDRGYPAAPESMVLTSGAQQALTVVLGALTRGGDIMMVEALTYPGIKNVARLFGLVLCPVEIDEHGLIPEAFAAACDRRGGKILYCMPNVHNPTTSILPAERRAAIADIAARHGVLIIEDDLCPRNTDAPTPTIAEIAPDRTIYITSLSKTIAPGLRVGTISSPPALLSELLVAAQTTAWMAPPLMTELACRWIEDGTAAHIAGQRDQATRRLHRIAGEIFAGLPYRHEPYNTHLWLPLDPTWTGNEFASKVAENGVLVSAAEQFAIHPAEAPPAVRICLSNIDADVLRRALETVAATARKRPAPVGFRM